MVRRNFGKLDKGNFLLMYKTYPTSDGVLRPGTVTPLEERYRVFVKVAEGSNEDGTWTPSTTL